MAQDLIHRPHLKQIIFNFWKGEPIRIAMLLENGEFKAKLVPCYHWDTQEYLEKLSAIQI